MVVPAATESVARILFLDIESTNLDADFGWTICVGLKWLGQPTKVLSVLDYPAFSRDPTNDSRLMKDVRDAMASADVWVTYYGKGFDVKFLNSRMMLAGLPVMPPIPHVDLYFTARTNLKLHSNRLASVGRFLGLKDKTPVDGPTWTRAAAGHKPSILAVVEHCRTDVDLLEEAYLKLRPFVRLHPNVGDLALGHCRVCGHNRLHKRGFHLTRTARKQRVQCQRCGAWDLRTP